jgi:hypothetical protein
MNRAARRADIERAREKYESSAWRALEGVQTDSAQEEELMARTFDANRSHAVKALLRAMDEGDPTPVQTACAKRAAYVRYRPLLRKISLDRLVDARRNEYFTADEALTPDDWDALE